ncbi:MAG: tetratricopeptide repeat protein [Candidatus Omnitrophica bacterium]|nr:tetratricopeptide repeat protein [Candidatus Omnitrophota bacterium]
MERGMFPRLAAAAVFCMAASFAQAAELRLKSGKVIEGSIIEQTDEFVRIEHQGMPLYFERKLITGIKDDTPVVQRRPVKKDPGNSGIAVSKTDQALLEGLKAGAGGRMDEARELLKEGLVFNPRNANILGALSILDEVTEGTVSREYARYLFKGSFYLMRREYREAANWLENARVLRPDDVDILYNLGVAYYSLKEFEKSVACLTMVLERAPQDAYAHSLLGNAYYMLGNDLLAGESLLAARNLFRRSGREENAVELENMLKELSFDGR